MARKLRLTAQAESTRIGDTTLGKSRRSALNRTPTVGTPRRVSPTVCMVQAALHDLQASSRKGITLYAIKKYICNKYEITMTLRRNKLIGNYLRGLLQAGDLGNISGKGLNGHIRLLTKKTRINERKSRGQANLNAPLRPYKPSILVSTFLLETPKSSQAHASGELPNLNCSDFEQEESPVQPPPKLKPKKRRLFGIDQV